MNEFYAFLMSVLPFEWSSHIFMLNALIAVIVISPLFSAFGTMVVTNKMAFFSDTLGHAALTGIAIGIMLGLADPMVAMVLFSVLIAVAASWLQQTTGTSQDTVIGVIASASVALGVVILSKGGGFAKYTSYLVGDMLAVDLREIVLLLILLMAILIFWVFYFNRVFVSSIVPALAYSRGVNVKVLSMCFCVLLAAVVALTVPWVGILIINSMLVLPAAAARNLCVGIRAYHFVTFIISLVSGIIGLIVSYYADTATGATIVLIFVGVYAFSVFYKMKLASGGVRA